MATPAASLVATKTRTIDGLSVRLSVRNAQKPGKSSATRWAWSASREHLLKGVETRDARSSCVHLPGAQEKDKGSSKYRTVPSPVEECGTRGR